MLAIIPKGLFIHEIIHGVIVLPLAYLIYQQKQKTLGVSPRMNAFQKLTAFAVKLRRNHGRKLVELHKKTKSPTKAILVVFITYIIDLDHLFDYFLHYGASFNFKYFLEGSQFDESGRAFIPFHAWEYLAILALASIKKGWNSWPTVFLFGYAPHLILDSINVESFLFYSLVVRAATGFSFLP